MRLAERLAIVLLAAQGEENIALAAGWKITRQKAARWRDRSAPQGSKGIDMDAPRSGRIPRISSASKKRGVQRTLQEKPAVASGLRDSTIGRIWKGHGLKPHLSRTFQRSNDQQFTEKLAAIGGRYLNPPEHAGGFRR